MRLQTRAARVRAYGRTLGKKTGLVLMIAFGVSGLESVPTSGPAFGATADPMRDFVVSCSYGVLAGTLVGAATLAFSDKPGDNLNKVARGASLGLYAGILLGAYVVYGGGPGEDEEAAAILNRGAIDLPVPPPPLAGDLHKARDLALASRVQLFPLLTERGLEGAAAQVRVLNF